MRTQGIVVLAALLAGCATLEHALPPSASPPPEDAARAEAPATALCADHPLVEAWEDRLRGEPALREVTEESLARGARYLPRMRAILERHGVPAALAVLPVVESGFDTHARGRHGELGLWQLRRPTARRFGLVVGARRDDRLLPDRATEAAALYLRYLGRRYGDWALAIAAYNAGERRVDRALARHPTATFWDLAARGELPRGSVDFVPHVIAVARVAEPTGC
jgi:membrane-bound lytic murein transglycosylase D